MKTSNKLVLTALFFLLASLAAYNMALKTEYRKGTYKDPYKDFTALNLRDFNELEINPASIMNVQVTAGPYGVWVRKGTDYATVKQTGRRLRLDAVFAEEVEYSGRPTVLIRCPQLMTLTTNAVYSVKGKQITEKIANPYRGIGVTVSGFAHDSLRISQDNASTVKLADNRFGLLRAVASLSAGSSSALHVLPSNRIGAAHLDIRHKGQLILEDIAIAQRHYQFADSAKATISGAALSALTR